jgi:hypothetical protein
VSVNNALLGGIGGSVMGQELPIYVANAVTTDLPADTRDELRPLLLLSTE